MGPSFLGILLLLLSIECGLCYRYPYRYHRSRSSYHHPYDDSREHGRHGSYSGSREHGSSSESRERHHRDSDEDDDRRRHHYTTVHGALHNHYHGDDGDDGSQKHYRFNLGAGANMGPYDYKDQATGEHRGFHRDFLAAVCAEAGKTCTWVLDRYSNCWDEEGGEQYPGVGLLADYYDACLGYFPTVDRTNSFNFSAPYSPNWAVGLFYKAGYSGNPTDLTGKKIGFARGWFTNPACLARSNGFRSNQPGEYEAVYFDTNTQAVDALLAKEVHAVWGFRTEYDSRSGELQAAGPDVYCSTGGLSLMARYSSQDLIDWWNKAVDRLQRNGDFDALCRRGRQEHGHRGELYCLT